MSSPITLAGFDQKFRDADDPWQCRDSRSELMKRHRALGGLPLVATALDIACGDGAGTRALAGRALHVDATDGSAAALASARRFLSGDPRIRFWHVRAPAELPRGRWRRILVSELAYYIAPHEISRLAEAIVHRLATGGELITVHHRVRFDDARTPPVRATTLLYAALGRSIRCSWCGRFGRYEIRRWVKPRRT